MNDHDQGGDDVVLAALPRPAYRDGGSDEELRVCLSEYNGKPYAQIRIWYADAATGTYKPTKRGTSIRPSEIREAVAALQEAMRRLEAADERPAARGSMNRPKAHSKTPRAAKPKQMPLPDARVSRPSEFYGTPVPPGSGFSTDPEILEHL